MKLTFEIQGYSITIEETEEGVSVVATKDDETVEEFTLELGGEEDFDDDDDFEDGDDFEDDDLEDEGDLGAQDAPSAQGQALPEGGEDMESPIGESKLESFSSFIKKRT